MAELAQWGSLSLGLAADTAGQQQQLWTASLSLSMDRIVPRPQKSHVSHPGVTVSGGSALTEVIGFNAVRERDLIQ